MKIENVYPLLIERIVDMDLLTDGQPLLFSTSRKSWYDFVINPIFEKPSKEEIIDELDMYKAEIEAQRLIDQANKKKRKELRDRLELIDLNRVGPLVGQSRINYGILKRQIIESVDETLVDAMEEKRDELKIIDDGEQKKRSEEKHGFVLLLKTIKRLCESENENFISKNDKPKILKYIKRKLSEL